MKYRLVTVHPFDPWGTKIGGIESFISTMLKHAPEDFELQLIGVTEDLIQRPIGRWQNLNFENKQLSFYPVSADLHPNRRSIIPLFLRFPLKLRHSGLSDPDALFLYHRIEPLALSSLLSRKNLLCIHGNPDEITGKTSEVKWRYIPWLYRFAEKRAIEKSQQTWVISQLGKSVLEGRYPAQKGNLSFLPTWYRDDIFACVPPDEKKVHRQNLSEKLHLPPSSRFILFAGRWEQQKNPLLAIESFSLMATKQPDVYLIMVGAGSLRTLMQEKINELNLQNRIIMMGMQPPLEVSVIMQGCEMFLLSSHFEGLPIVMLEALASGLPVVSTDTGEVKSVICRGQTGIAVSRMEAQPLAQALQDVLTHPDQFNSNECAKAAEAYRPKSILPGFFDEIRKNAGIVS